MILYTKRGQKRIVAGEEGQMMVEYAVMFTVIVAVIVYASVTFIKPAMNRYFSATDKIINTSTQKVLDNF